MKLDHIAQRIDSAFGDELPFSDREVTDQDREVLGRVFGDDGFHAYLQDQVDRQIIRDYLINAVMLGHLREQQLAAFDPWLLGREGRAALSLHMLMTAVEQAAELLDSGQVPQRLNQLRPGSASPPYVKLVPI